ncbi:MAG: hypothetical protein J3R72DRAFT_242946 [Linnemannia gamsii]|nr:MAG: hypothetical protein J3R72DRAFT_242946 [Linnemannia gamsii]
MSLPPPPPLPSVTFFHLPELASLLASFLRASDISCLMQTSRAMNNLFHPCFWYHLEIVPEAQIIRLIKSPEAFSALVRNFDRIRSLKTTLVFLCFQYVAALEYMERNSNSDSIDSANTDDNDTTNAQHVTSVPLKLAKPAWHPSPSYRSYMYEVEPLPLFTHLNRLDLNLQSLYGGRYLGFAVSMYNTAPLVLTACWLFGLNPGLTDVRLHGFDVPTPLSIRVLARSISKLHNLKNLELKANSLPTFYDVALVFFALPQSIVSFKWKGELTHFAPLPDLDMSLNDPDWYEGLIVQRAEPLQNLKTLELPADTTGYLHHQLKHIFKHCPVIETLEFPFVNLTDGDCVFMAEDIKATCQRIRHVYVGRQYRDGRGRCLLGVTETLPRHQLETLQFTGIRDEAPGRLVLTVTSHSESLRRIVFQEAIRLQSNGIQEILTSCRGLNHLEISGVRHSQLAITLSDAIAAPWACPNLKYLGLSVDLGVYNVPQTGEDDETKRWIALETFYRQLGTLTKLEILDLKSVGIRVNLVETEIDLSIESKVFPRLLILENKATDRRGYLTMLAGLRELRELRGSVRLDAMEWSSDPSAVVGQAEVEWMAKQWTQLKLVTLLPDNHDMIPTIEVPPHLKWLQAQLPNLRLSRHFRARYHGSEVVTTAGSRTFTAGSVFTAGSASGAIATTATTTSILTAGSSFTAAPASTISTGFTFTAAPVTMRHTGSSTIPMPFTTGPTFTASTTAPTMAPSFAASQPATPPPQP